MKLHVKVTLTEEMLGTKAANKDVFADFIASKAPDEDKRKQELANAEHREEAGTTVFHRMNGVIGIYDYQMKGFFKDACGSLRRAEGSLSKEVKAYKTKIDGLIFVAPRFIPFVLPEGGKVDVCERPLRAETAQGPRVTVVRSETVPAGTSFEFHVTSLAAKFGKDDGKVDVTDLLREWFDYGQLRGLGCWRNGGKGRFTAEITEHPISAQE